MEPELPGRRALLIGIGNALRGDDGVGVVLVEELAQELGGWSTSRAVLQAVHQLTPELVLAVAQASRVLLLDACVSPRTVAPWLEGLSPAAGDDPWASAALAMGNAGGHQLSPSALLTLARCLYGWQGKGGLLHVPAFSFPHGMGLSAPLLRGLPEARRLLRQWLEQG